MALINCPECSGKISDTVKSCIHCGYNLNPPAQNKTQDSFSKSVEEWKSVDDIRVALKKLMNYKGFVSISIDDYYVQVANNGAESEELTFEAVSGDYIPAIGNKDKEFDALGFGHDSGENYRKYLAFDEFSADTVIKEVKLIFESIYNKDFSSYEIETDFEERLAKSDSGAHQKKPNVFSKKTDKNGNEILVKINKAIEDNERLNSFKEWYSKDTDWNAKGISKLEKVDRLKHSFLKTVFIMVSGFVLMALFFWLLPYLIILGGSLVVGHYFGKFYGWGLGIIGALILITGGFSYDVDACECVDNLESYSSYLYQQQRARNKSMGLSSSHGGQPDAYFDHYSKVHRACSEKFNQSMPTDFAEDYYAKFGTPRATGLTQARRACAAGN